MIQLRVWFTGGIGTNNQGHGWLRDGRVSCQVRVCRRPADRSRFAAPIAGLRACVSRQARVCPEQYFPWVGCVRAGRGLLPPPRGGRVWGPAVLKGARTCCARGGAGEASLFCARTVVVVKVTISPLCIELAADGRTHAQINCVSSFSHGPVQRNS